MFEIFGMLAVAVFAVGLLAKLIPYGWNRLALPSEMVPRTATPYPPQGGMPMAKAAWEVNIGTSLKYWWRANPIMYIGHMSYHAGLYLALGIYGFVTLMAYGNLPSGGLVGRVIYVCEWCSHRATVFSQHPIIGYATYGAFLASLVLACTGITIPFVMSLAGKRGLVRPIDRAMRDAGITRVHAPSFKKSLLGYERKFVGLIVLVMDWSMLISLITGGDWGCGVHVVFGFTILAMMPSSFLFHEMYKMRMWGAVRRFSDGRTA